MWKKIKFNLPPLLFMIFMTVFLINSSSVDEQEAEERINGFYTDPVPESILDRLLLDAGKGIVPHLIVKIKDKDMPMRGYAIGALIRLEARSAVPVLLDILNDPYPWERTTALTAIWYLDRELGEELVVKHYGEDEYMDHRIERLKSGKSDDVYIPMICRPPFFFRFIPSSCKKEYIL
jgi:HEAT repeat protein